MERILVDKSLFNFKYLPEYSGFLLDHHLEEYVTVGIRFCRELNLPMLKPLSHIPEKELVALSMDSNKKILSELKAGNIAAHIEENLNNWVANKIDIIDQLDVEVEDLTLAYHIRRKLFSYFLYRYTQSAPIQSSIFSELDVYTSMEELISLKTYFVIRNLKNNSAV